ncbi:helix-turn-helix domain-containing protein [Micromonospora sp. CPCC 205371]|nr:helix-turn-helix domain-containing protein [Micromonospora sp. CPCC 205371]
MDSFGEALRRTRCRAGVSLDVLARKVNFDKSYLSKVENGRRRGSRVFAEQCDTALGAAGDLIAAYEEDVRRHETMPAAGVAFADVYRRTFLNLGAAAAGAAALAGIDLADDAPLTEADVAKLDQVVARLRALDARHGAAGLWDVAAARAQGIVALLDQAEYSQPVGDALVRLAGRAYICAGWLATDAGRHDAAHTYYTESLALAEQAASADTQVHALANLALHAVILRRPRQALRYVAAAQRLLPAQPVSRVQAMLTMRRGRSLAMLGDGREAARAFTDARHTLDEDRGTPPQWLEFFNHPEIDAVEADAALDLRDGKRGAALLEQSLAAYEPRFARNRCLHLVRLAKARVTARQVVGAAEAASDALRLLDGDVASARVGSEFRLLTEQLHPHRRTPEVADVLAWYRTTPYGTAP